MMESCDKKGVKKTTTPEQFEVLVAELEKNPELARGAPVFGTSREKVENIWAEIAVKINSHGPPQRSALEWKKIWADLKSRTKKKIAENTRNLKGTGGGPFNHYKLTELEASIDRLVNMSTAAAPDGRPLGIPVPEEPVDEKREAATSFIAQNEPASPQQESNNEPSGSTQKVAIKRRKNYAEEQLKLIKLEIKNQQLILEQMQKQNAIAQEQAEAIKMQAQATQEVVRALQDLNKTLNK